jgi:deaminated glutathione amidase
MQIAVAQFAAGMDKAANLATAQAFVGEAADAGATLVIAPEAAMHDFGPQELALAPIAEPIDGAFVSGLAEIAADRHVTVVAGMFESVQGDRARAYNTVVAIGPSGELIGRYRKQHLFDAFGWRESERLVGGDTADRLVFDCGEFRVGVITCYDIRFPEITRALVDDGATLLAVPSAWVAGPSKARQFRTLATARAIENVCYLAGAVQSPPSYTGESCIIDPFGELIAELADADGIAVGDISAKRVLECRERVPSLSHRRWRVAPGL